MKRFDFYISNNNHHWQMLQPVMLELKKMGNAVRLVSLCEFRRMETPEAELAILEIPFVRLMNLRKRGLSTSSGRSIGGNKGLFRNLLREVVWWLRLRSELASINKEKPALVVVPNDIAFPFDRICRWYTFNRIPFVLMQEGIRFPLPNEEGRLNYGGNGAREIICWGNQSAEYFRSLQLGNTTIVKGGNPRFDNMLQMDYGNYVKEIQEKYSLPEQVVLYVSNPVDDQGFCSHDQKMNLFRRFLRGLDFQLKKNVLKVLIRLHPREDIYTFRAIIDELGFQEYVFFVQEYPIFACIQSARLSVVLASTVGLESAINNRPVAVVKLGTHGFVFDYVSSGAALGIDVETEFSNLLWEMMTSGYDEYRDKCERYVENQLDNRGSSAKFIAKHLDKTLKEIYAEV